MRNLPFIIFLLITVFNVNSYAVVDEAGARTIKWKEYINQKDFSGEEKKYLYFEGAINNITSGNLPLYFERFNCNAENIIFEFLLEDLVFETLDVYELEIIKADTGLITTDISIKSQKILDRKHIFYGISFIPIRKNPVSATYEKLISFSIKILRKKHSDKIPSKSRQYVEHSVLQKGKWYKFSVQKSGVYIIDKNDLAAIGIDPSVIDPRKIAIYGNGGKMLPEKNNDFRNDDLVENAIFVKGEDDGVFDDDDHILFYGTSPDVWEYDTSTSLYYHQKNLYSDHTYYFLNIGLKEGKRIQPEFSTTLPQTHNINKFDDHKFHEKDEHNLIGSGKVWYGEVFNSVTSYTFSEFSFPHIDQSSSVTLIVDLAARSFVSSTFTITATGMPSPVIPIIYPVSQAQNTDFAKTKKVQQTFLPSEDDIVVNITYNKSTQGSMGWLNYIAINASRNLVFSDDQMHFRNAACVGPGNISEFELSNVSQYTTVWDVSDPFNVRNIDTFFDDSVMTFRLTTDSLKEFIAFNGNSFIKVDIVGEVANQDLHSIASTDLIIVSHEDFLDQAERLAHLHLKYDNFSSCVVTPGEIYNEFSSGRRDVTAIRDFVKMLYDRAQPGSEPRYLLLFGDGSYDNVNRLNANTNFIPTFQSINSLLSTSTYVTDDYFGLLDDGEGLNAYGSLDIGIGRFPVQTNEQAKSIVDKIEYYISPSDTSLMITGRPEKYGDWRNLICFIADDEDGNLHLNQAEHLAKTIEKGYKNYNIDKIYLDAYPQVSTPGGDRYPEVNTAINERISKGSLLVNYIGHGGEQGWAFENVIQISDITKWDNYSSMPAFLTATCEFSRFDDPFHTTAGEHVVLNPEGGGISIFSTTRVAFASSNFSLTISMYDHIFEKTDQHYPRLGDLIRLSKNDNNNDGTLKNFVLLGDPALKLNYPEYTVITEKINNNPVSADYDTLKANDKVTVNGYISDHNGDIINDFNGIIYPVVYDKASEISTLGNDNNGSSLTFRLQNRILYKARSEVKNGLFSFCFMMPKDINYSYGEGKISYYAENGIIDANGHYNGIIIGGTGNNNFTDQKGPDIEIYINDTNFISGGLSTRNPFVLAHLYDKDGINAYGNGIGHEITATLDGNTEDIFVLNSYYLPDINTYQSGKINFQLHDLDEGLHHLKIKAWDMLNNSSEAIIEFLVSESEKPDIYYVLNYPNPFFDETRFVFKHNQAGKELNVVLQIFNISGQKLLQRYFLLVPENFNTEFFVWDGKGDNGNPLAKGVYVYRLIIRNDKGLQNSASQKLVILK